MTKMIKCNLIIFGSALTFIELAQAYKQSLTQLGINVVNTVFIIDMDSTKLPPVSDLNFFIVGRFKLLHHERFQHMYIKRYRSSINILVLLEQTSILKRLSKVEIKFDYIFYTFLPNKLLNRTQNLISCPLGWSQAYSNNNSSSIIYPNSKQNTVFTFGTMTEYRQIVVSKLKIVNYTNVYGAIRDNLILNSKINLIIKAYENYKFPPLHYLLIACKHKLVLCNKHNSYNPFIPNKHMIIAPNIELSSTINYWATHIKERIQFQTEVAKDLKYNYSNTMYLEKALKKISVLKK